MGRLRKIAKQTNFTQFFLNYCISKILNILRAKRPPSVKILSMIPSLPNLLLTPPLLLTVLSLPLPISFTCMSLPLSPVPVVDHHAVFWECRPVQWQLGWCEIRWTGGASVQLYRSASGWLWSLTWRKSKKRLSRYKEKWGIKKYNVTMNWGKVSSGGRVQKVNERKRVQERAREGCMRGKGRMWDRRGRN